MTSDGTVIATVPAGGATDAAGNPNTASTSTDNTVTRDATFPTVSSINRNGTTPTNAASVSWTVTFSESVTGVDSADFSLSPTVTGATITGVTGTGDTYTVTVGTGTGSGTLQLNLVDNDTIQDAATNRLGGTGAGNGNFSGEAYAIDKVSATVTANSAAGQANPTNQTPINYTVTFSEPVAGFTAADVTLGGTAGATTKMSSTRRPERLQRRGQRHDLRRHGHRLGAGCGCPGSGGQPELGLEHGQRQLRHDGSGRHARDAGEQLDHERQHACLQRRRRVRRRRGQRLHDDHDQDLHAA